MGETVHRSTTVTWHVCSLWIPVETGWSQWKVANDKVPTLVLHSGQ